MNKVILFFPIAEEREDHLLPLSLLLVAAPLVNAGYQVKIIDQRVENNWKEILLKELKEKPLAVGFSVLTGKQILYGLEASELVKQNSKAKVVWGGVHPSLLPEQTLENKFIDLVIIGEGEKTFLKLVKRLDKKEEYSNLEGLAYKKNGEIDINSERNFIDLDNQPDIPYYLIDIEKYISQKSFATGRPARDISFYTSRGCPHRCAFCYNKQFNQGRWRTKSAERVVREIEYLKENYQINSLNVQDDEFFTDTERVRKICQILQDKNIKINFLSTCRIDYICRMDDEFLNLIAESGFKTLSVGVESGSSKILKDIHKDIDKEQVLKAVNKLKKFNIGGKYFFMCGFPQETGIDFFQTTDLMREIKINDPYARIPAWRIFTPYPGTDLYNVSIDYGWFSPQSLEEWAYYNFKTSKMPWINFYKKRIIKNVAYLIQFLGLKDKKLSWLHKVVGLWVNFRWKNHLFFFVPEKYLINSIIWFKRKLI